MKKTSARKTPGFSLLGQKPAPPPPPTADALAALLAQITAASAGLQPCYRLLYKTPLTTSQRKSLAAVLPPHPRALVRATVYALQGTDQHHAPLFADLPIDARTLGLTQDVASALQLLDHHIDLLHSLCKDAVLQAQARAVELAREAIATTDQEPPPSDLRGRMRQLAMSTPRSLDSTKGKKPLKSGRASSRTRR